VGTAVTLQGSGWPAQSFVNISLTQPYTAGTLAQPPQVIASGVPVNAAGEFAYTFTIPVGQGWENQTQIVILVMTANQLYSAVTPFYVGQGSPGVIPPDDGSSPSPWRPLETPAWGPPSRLPGQSIRPMG
jgi:hypothetical protein